MDPDLTRVIDENHRALNAFAKGDSKPLAALYSPQDDVSLANPFGPAVRGFEQVAEMMELAALNYRDGEATGFERISESAAGISRTSSKSTASGPRSAARTTSRRSLCA